jgi:hypothetical protein
MFVLLVSGWGNASEAVEVFSVSYALDSISEGKGWIGSVIFAGMLVGGPCAGLIADRFVRIFF